MATSSAFCPLAWDAPTSRAPAPRLPEESLDRAPEAIVAPQSRPIWNVGNFGIGNPLFRVPQRQNLLLFEQLEEAIPLLPAAISRLADLVGTPKVEAEDDVQAELTEWMDRVRVNRIQTGFSNWVGTWIQDMLLYGRAHAELILTADRRDISAIQELHTRTIELRPTTDGYSLEIVQLQAFAGTPVLLDPRTIVSAVHEISADDPHGRALLFGMPFVGQIMTTMLKALGQQWERAGAPMYHISYVPPDTLSDPTAAVNKAFIGSVTGQWNRIMADRKQNRVRDLATAGNVTVKVVGAEGEILQITDPLRAIEEQIVARTGLPPMLLGLQWATTERMAAVLAALLSQSITGIREEVTAELRYVLALRQALSGGSQEFEIGWEAPNVLDEVETARGRLFDAQARQQQIANLQTEWHMGLRTGPEVARELKPELVGKSDEEVRALLPLLLEMPPAPPPLLVMPTQPATGPNAPPPTGPGGAQPLQPTTNGRGNGRQTS